MLTPEEQKVLVIENNEILEQFGLKLESYYPFDCSDKFMSEYKWRCLVFDFKIKGYPEDILENTKLLKALTERNKRLILPMMFLNGYLKTPIKRKIRKYVQNKKHSENIIRKFFGDKISFVVQNSESNLDLP